MATSKERHLVTVLDKSTASLLDSSSASSAVSVVRLADPGTGELRSYLLLGNKDDTSPPDNSSTTITTTTATLCELHSLPAAQTEYAAFLVAGHILGSNGDSNSLYTMTPVDPLFWVLDAAAAATATGEEQQQWQPLEQLLSSFNFGAETSLLRSLLDRTQLSHHLLERINISGGDDNDEDAEFCYRFSSEKALAWLTRKQQAVECVLLRQEQEQADAKRAVATKSETKSNGGAFSSDFQLPEELQMENERPNSNKNNSIIQDCKKNMIDTTRAKEESIQIVCSQLNQYWTDRFIQEHLGLTSEILLGKEARRKRKLDEQEKNGSCGGGVTTNTSSTNQLPAVIQDWNAALQQPGPLSSGAEAAAAYNKKLKPQAKPTIAARKLEKVNKKGMQKLTSFFTAKKK